MDEGGEVVICTLVVTAAIFYLPAGKPHYAHISYKGCENKGVRVILRGTAPKKVSPRGLQLSICPRSRR